MKKAKIGITGAAGYTGGELLRLLLNHPAAEIVFACSQSNAGRKISDIHTDLEGDTDLIFSEKCPLDDIDILFQCSAHGESRKFWDENPRPEHLKVIDLAQDYRDESNGYVYGLPELNRSRIKGARSIANPGCFATAIQLSLLPLAAAGLLNGDIHVTAVTGSTGAGVKPSQTTHFSYRDNNLSVYKAFNHQHLTEIKMNLQRLQPDMDPDIIFIPVRGDFPRGIFSMITLRSELKEEDLYDIYRKFYADAPFVKISESPVSLKQAVNTSKALIHLQKQGDLLLITCAEDNLLKGASGQAVQNMNLMLGIEEDTGLKLKPSAF